MNGQSRLAADCREALRPYCKINGESYLRDM